MKHSKSLFSLALTIGLSCAALAADGNRYAPSLGATGEKSSVYVGYDTLEKQYLDGAFNYQIGVALAMDKDQSCLKLMVNEATGEVGCASSKGEVVSVGRIVAGKDKVDQDLELTLKEVAWNTAVVEIAKRTVAGYDLWSLKIKNQK